MTAKLTGRRPAAPLRTTGQASVPEGGGRFMSSQSPLLQARGREAALKRHRPPDDPAVLAAVADRRNAAAEQYIQRLLAETPPLTAEERLHLTRLLTEPDRGSAA